MIELQRNSRDVYYVEIGLRISRHGQTRPCRFDLGTNVPRARRLAAVLLEIWERHGRHWTTAAILESRKVFKTVPAGRQRSDPTTHRDNQ